MTLLHNMIKTLLACALCACHVGVLASEPAYCAADSASACDEPALRPVTSAYSIEAGNAHIADTYLTPLHYRGWHSALAYERTQAMRFSPDKFTMQLRLGISYDQTKSPAGNSVLRNAAGTAAYTIMRRWQPVIGLTMAAGPIAGVDVGALYMQRNGNNPVAAKASATIGVTGIAAYNTRLCRLPLTLRYQPTLPVAGVFFAPDYGELYYQIYAGTSGKLVHPAWWGNHFRFDNLVTADLHLGNTSVRVGYRCEIFSSKVNNIVSQNITHALVLGVATEWISLRPDSRRIKARLIPAY